MNKLQFIVFIILFSTCERNGQIMVPPDDPSDTTSTDCENPKSSNVFEWEIDSLGEKESVTNSIAGGVFAFSDSDAYAMGMFIKNGKAYPGAHWNGKRWNLISANSTIQIASFAVTGDSKRMVAVGGKFSVLGQQEVLEFTTADKIWKRTIFSGYEGNLNTVWTDGNGYYIAGGDKGLLVEKASDISDWKIITCPVDYFVQKIDGFSKDKIFLLGSSLKNGKQIWSRNDGNWNLLYDQSRTDTTFALNIPLKSDMADISVFYCSESSSVSLNVGTIPVKTFSVVNNCTEFIPAQNPFATISREMLSVYPFAKNDIWLTGNYLYHYNGKSLAKISFTGNFSNFSAGIPYVTSSGKVFTLLIAWDHALAIAQTRD
ncbi:MAG: hypothetical protein L6Q77_08350 [Bacteroidetes bacterium]|nr:hypothetical protein [Bacteroidota bacterium]